MTRLFASVRLCVQLCNTFRKENTQSPIFPFSFPIKCALTVGIIFLRQIFNFRNCNMFSQVLWSHPVCTAAERKMKSRHSCTGGPSRRHKAPPPVFPTGFKIIVHFRPLQFLIGTRGSWHPLFIPAPSIVFIFLTLSHTHNYGQFRVPNSPFMPFLGTPENLDTFAGGALNATLTGFQQKLQRDWSWWWTEVHYGWQHNAWMENSVKAINGNEFFFKL